MVSAAVELSVKMPSSSSLKAMFGFPIISYLSRNKQKIILIRLVQGGGASKLRQKAAKP